MGREIVDWTNPEGLIEIDLEEKGGEMGVLYCYSMTVVPPMISRGDYCLFLRSFVKQVLCK